MKFDLEHTYNKHLILSLKLGVTHSDSRGRREGGEDELKASLGLLVDAAMCHYSREGINQVDLERRQVSRANETRGEQRCGIRVSGLGNKS